MRREGLQIYYLRTDPAKANDTDGYLKQGVDSKNDYLDKMTKHYTWRHLMIHLLQRGIRMAKRRLHVVDYVKTLATTIEAFCAEVKYKSVGAQRNVHL